MCYDIAYSGGLEELSSLLPEFPRSALRGLERAPRFHASGHGYPDWPVVLPEQGSLRLRMLSWGLLAPYMDSPEKIRRMRPWMLNARSERILGDPRSYWHRIRGQRCVVPVSGFFEHRDVGRSRKIPYYISAADGGLLALAGLYAYGNRPDPETGELSGSFSIVTRTANPLLRAIHNSGENRGRMPLMLDRSTLKEWLDPDLEDGPLAALLDQEYPASALQYRTVAPIRRPHPDTPELLQAQAYEGIPPLEPF